MKANDIEKIYTAKVAEYLAKGYTINPATMSGHQGEIAKIDLKKDGEIIRILLDRTHTWDRVDDREIDAVVLRVGRNTDPLTQMRRPFGNWNTIWNEHLEILEERLFYQIDTNADYFTEDRSAYLAMKQTQLQHWRNHYYSRSDMNTARLETPAAIAVAQRYIKRRLGKKAQAANLTVTRTRHNNKTTYTIGYGRTGYNLH